MRQPRTTRFLWIFTAAWLATAGPPVGGASPCPSERKGRGYSGVELVGAGRPSVELSIRREERKRVGLPLRDQRLGVSWPQCQTRGTDAFFFACQYLEGQLSALEQKLFVDAADGRWDEHSLLTASLVASGVDDPQRLRRYEVQVAALIAELRRPGRLTGSPQDKAEAVLEFMHRRILVGGYQLDCTDLTLALDEGRFNCVSTSVLFTYLSQQVGLATCGLEVPGHVMSRVVLPDRTLDVETTCPGWFRLIGDPKKQAWPLGGGLASAADVGAARPFSGTALCPTDGLVRPSAAEGYSPADVRQLSPVELVAMIYYNRGVDLLSQKRFAQALSANAKALRLDPSSATARGNLLATLNNWAIDLGNQRRYAEAAELLRSGIRLDPDYATFKTNYVHVHHRWIQQLCRAGQFQDALELLDTAAETVCGEPYFDHIRLDVRRLWANSASQDGDYSKAALPR